MIGRQRLGLGIMAFGTILLSGLFAVLADDLEEAAVVFVVWDPAGLCLTGNEGENADDDDNQRDKEPVPFFDSHINTPVASDGMIVSVCCLRLGLRGCQLGTADSAVVLRLRGDDEIGTRALSE